MKQLSYAIILIFSFHFTYLQDQQSSTNCCNHSQQSVRGCCGNSRGDMYFHVGNPSATLTYKDLSQESTTVQSLTENNVSSESKVNLHLDFHIAQTVSQWTSLAKESSEKMSKTMLQGMKNNKWKFLGVTICSLYGYIWFQIKKTNRLVNEKNSWCNWKEVVSLSSLMASSQQDLKRELLQEIKKQQVLKKLTEGASSEEVHFVQSIMNELEQLRWYLELHDSCKKWFYLRAFCFSIDPVHVQEKIARLYFLIDLFSSWQTDQYMSEVDVAE